MLAGLILMEYSHIIPFWLSLLLPILIGILCGMFNGLFTGFLRLNPFIVTLATMMLFEGLKILISGGFCIPGRYLPELYLLPGSDLTIAIISFIVISAITGFFLKYTKWGIHIYVVGGNQNVAHMMGINLRLMLLFIFTLSGMFSGIAALFYTGFNRSVPVTIGSQVLFPSFAGAIIGGISLQGGRGSIINSVGGALLLGIIEAFLVTFAITPEARIVGYGAIVLIAILFNQFRESLRDSILRRI
jgi:ribose/xylose/arabinose/galactoside ABC-type transport system permease subunit